MQIFARASSWLLERKIAQIQATIARAERQSSQGFEIESLTGPRAEARSAPETGKMRVTVLRKSVQPGIRSTPYD